MAKRSVGVYKVLNSNDLTLLVYRHYLCFILDLRRMKNVPVYISNHDSFLLDTDRPPAAFYFPIHAKCIFFFFLANALYIFIWVCQFIGL